MHLSVIVPTYLMQPDVHDLWAEHQAQLIAVAQVPTELIVVDNGSAYPPTHAAVAWPKNRGVAPAWNEGVRHATGEVLAFVTCTTRVEPGWDANLCAVAQSGRLIAMPYTNGAKPYGIGVTGWCWAIQRTFWNEVGEFDETFVPVQYEDSDFFQRAIDLGIELVNVPTAHVTRTAQRRSWGSEAWGKRARLIHMSNRFRFSFKHGNDPSDTLPFWKTPLRDVAPQV